MKLILCIDAQGGLMFHDRRQSQDRMLRQDLLRLCHGHALWVTPYTARQFEPIEQDFLTVTEIGFARAPEDAYCFLEAIDPLPYMENAAELVLYCWNRVYPSDQRLELPLTGWQCIQQIEFSGFSHEKITREVYKR